MSKRLVLLVLFLLFLAFSAGAETEPTLGGIIREIEIKGNRVRESVIRKELTFTEGDRISEAAIEKSKGDAPAEQRSLKYLARLSRRLVHDEFRDGLKAAAHAAEVVRLVSAALAD